VNQIEPNENGDDWLFEIAFGPGDLARHHPHDQRPHSTLLANPREPQA
jgi:hypothetical protein